MVVKIGIYHDQRKSHPWIARWFGEYDPETGKKRRYSKSFKLKRHAEEFKAEKTDKFRKGLRWDRPAEMTLKTFCADWLKTKKPEVRKGTLTSYKETIDRLYNHFGKHHILSKVTTYQAANFISELQLAKDFKRPRSLSNWTRKKILRNCRIIFKSAVTWHLIDNNPFEDIKTPKVVTSRWHYLGPDQYKALLEVAPSLKCKALYALAYTAGLRLGEAFSLTWSDIDFDTAEVIVENHPATKTLPPFYIKDYEARRIPLPKHTLDILTRLHAEAEEGVPYVLLTKDRYQIIATKWQKLRRECNSWENRYMTNNTLQNFKRHLKRAGIEPTGTLSLHTLRKCCGKNWADNLPANVTRELMGHSKIETTMKYYNQVDEHQRLRAAAVIDALIGDRKLEMSDAKMTPEA